MDVEQQNILDEIMEQTHQIGWWMREYAEKENNGVSIPKEKILENKSINALFLKLQENFRKLQESTENMIEDAKRMYQGSESAIKAQLLQNCTAQMTAYAQNGYMSLKYIPYFDMNELAKMAKNGNMSFLNNLMVSPGIYHYDFEEIVKAECESIITGIGNLNARIKSQSNPEKFSFSDKSFILEQIALERFFEGKAISSIENVQNQLSKQLKNKLEIEKLEQIRKVIEIKYVYYFRLLNEKYNGFLQKNDQDKFEQLEYARENGLLSQYLNMTDFEIEQNININTQPYAEELFNQIAGIIEPQNKNLRFKPNNKKIDNNKSNNQDIDKSLDDEEER